MYELTNWINQFQVWQRWTLLGLAAFLLMIIIFAEHRPITRGANIIDRLRAYSLPARIAGFASMIAMSIIIFFGNSFPGSAGEWQHEAFPGHSGNQVADKLSQLGSRPEDVVVYYDGVNNAFHVWYRREGAGTKYTYAHGPVLNATNAGSADRGFLRDSATVPAGLGYDSGRPVLIYFKASN